MEKSRGKSFQHIGAAATTSLATSKARDDVFHDGSILNPIQEEEEVDLASSLSASNVATRSQSTNEIKATLKNKVKKYLIAKNIEFDSAKDETRDEISLDIGQIESTNIKNGEFICKCLVKCIKCETRISCLYDKYWKISNFQNI